ncbi:hypothetical protein GTO89_06540 [Heliobacterium gestii]|uniref:FIST domain containing protein n=1 Tax=Heliomicrobium gestii TaxID=2699 RepID=A0A845LIK9_HELGE|nr:FIST N-terminal domain-containing protein [Heliomicrobium gestii]MBM7865969.1 hypothetical protein [Heliomicrobium gestii]MZP42696.1 hypothetical protein [Heliomicrobium gestii]
MNLVAASPLVDTASAVRDIRNTIDDQALVVFFASSCHDPHIAARLMKEAFPRSTVVGCTTAGEIWCDPLAGVGKMASNHLVAMSFSEEIVGPFHAEVVGQLSQSIDIAPALAGFEQAFGIPVAAMDPDEYLGMILIDGLICSEEALMEKLGDTSDILFVGGSAGDDFKLQGTYVFLDGQAYNDAALLLVMKPKRKFQAIKTQSFTILPHRLQVTGACQRSVSHFNGQPAGKAYADALGIPLEKAPEQFVDHPVGLMIDGEPYVRSPQKINDQGGLDFYSSLLEGMELRILESLDPIADTESAIAAAQQAMGGLSSVILFNCANRTVDMERRRITGEFEAMLGRLGAPVIGFSSYGEMYIGHINQTATMIAFG